MMCPFCHALGIDHCCRISGCWNRVHKEPSREQRKIEKMLLPLMLAHGCFRDKKP